jgi:hypothetical protein
LVVGARPYRTALLAEWIMTCLQGTPWWQRIAAVAPLKPSGSLEKAEENDSSFSLCYPSYRYLAKRILTPCSKL